MFTGAAGPGINPHLPPAWSNRAANLAQLPQNFCCRKSPVACPQCFGRSEGVARPATDLERRKRGNLFFTNLSTAAIVFLVLINSLSIL